MAIRKTTVRGKKFNFVLLICVSFHKINFLLPSGVLCVIQTPRPISKSTLLSDSLLHFVLAELLTYRPVIYILQLCQLNQRQLHCLVGTVPNMSHLEITSSHKIQCLRCNIKI